MSAAFLLVCFVCLEEGAFGIGKGVFGFTLTALFALEIIGFSLFRYSKDVVSANTYAWGAGCILLNNLGGKHM